MDPLARVAGNLVGVSGDGDEVADDEVETEQEVNHGPRLPVRQTVMVFEGTRAVRGPHSPKYVGRISKVHPDGSYSVRGTVPGKQVDQVVPANAVFKQTVFMDPGSRVKGQLASQQKEKEVADRAGSAALEKALKEKSHEVKVLKKGNVAVKSRVKAPGAERQAIIRGVSTPQRGAKTGPFMPVCEVSEKCGSHTDCS